MSLLSMRKAKLLSTNILFNNYVTGMSKISSNNSDTMCIRWDSRWPNASRRKFSKLKNRAWFDLYRLLSWSFPSILLPLSHLFTPSQFSSSAKKGDRQPPLFCPVSWTVPCYLLQYRVSLSLSPVPHPFGFFHFFSLQKRLTVACMLIYVESLSLLLSPANLFRRLL